MNSDTKYQDELDEAMARLRNMILDLKIWFATDIDAKTEEAP